MFATRKFRDEAGIIDPGFIRASFSASGNASGRLIDSWAFRKLVFELYAEGVQYGNKTLQVFSCSTSVSSISSASSNWTAIDSANFAVTMASSLASGSANRYCAILEARPERWNGSVNSASFRYIRPVILCTSGVSSNSVDNAYLAIKGLLPQFGPASLSEPVTTMVTSEVLYL